MDTVWCEFHYHQQYDRLQKNHICQVVANHWQWMVDPIDLADFVAVVAVVVVAGMVAVVLAHLMDNKPEQIFVFSILYTFIIFITVDG